MGFRVVAFEPVFENLQRICDGVYLNRVQDQVVVYHAAASDRVGNITMHKVSFLLQIAPFKSLSTIAFWIAVLSSTNQMFIDRDVPRGAG